VVVSMLSTAGNAGWAAPVPETAKSEAGYNCTAGGDAVRWGEEADALDSGDGVANEGRGAEDVGKRAGALAARTNSCAAGEASCRAGDSRDAGTTGRGTASRLRLCLSESTASSAAAQPLSVRPHLCVPISAQWGHAGETCTHSPPPPSSSISDLRRVWRQRPS
jgi:hypothetical protein